MALDRARLEDLLRTHPHGAFWRELAVLEEVGSTNDLLRERAEWGAPEGTVVIAERQTSGRGRAGRRWESEPGGAWFSVLLRPPLAPERLGPLGFLLAGAVAQGLQAQYDLPVRVKWPNDLLLAGKKLGGVLVELVAHGARKAWVIGGIGLNVNNPLPAQARVPPTSLAQALGCSVPLEGVLALALGSVAQAYQRFLVEGFSAVRELWWALAAAGPRTVVRVHRHGKRFPAEVLDLDETGRLLVLTDRGVEALTAEEVTLEVPP